MPTLKWKSRSVRPGTHARAAATASSARAWLLGKSVMPKYARTRGVRAFEYAGELAPVFGLVIAIIGCRHGLKVGGDVESLGARVTTSVVQSIFAVIVIDALFAMMYLELDI